ncbi:lipopolysaccharide biosynthesis protein RfbH [Campylobacter sp. CLAX-22107-21]|uniref:lipopolysaccharide biosynthesis protein RfbH n=1 Tax=Campylobacter devanensis TaxID=3161138 RepID=UPI002ECD1361|nr:lipopolysaccharide biosynthesis protein RfbH [Campylobacter sp. CLAX-22107-21]
MFENKTKQEATKQILDLVREYHDKYMVRAPWQDGDRINYAGRVFDADEMVNLADSALEFWLTSGRYTEHFEKELGKYLNLPFVSLVNSGSSANLLAFMALTSPLLKERQIKRGDEVISVACGFPTTITPILQYGAVPVFVDVSLETGNIDVNMLEKALSPKTKAVMLAHSLGNPFDIKAVSEFCEKYNLWLIEDNCDALGSEYTLDGKTRKTGTFGDIGTSSFYPPHHLTMGEGGAVYTSSALLNRIIRSFRDWGRDCYCPSGKDDTCGCRFSKQYGKLPLGFDHKYTYSHFGYNLKATDMQAAIGCAQLKKLESFTKKRRENFEYLKAKLESTQDKLLLPQATENSNPSWFGFLMLCKDGVSRNDLVLALEKSGIQTRALFAGNIIKHPCFDSIRNSDAYRVVGELTNTDKMMNNAFWVGVYPGMSSAMLDKIAKVIIENL